MTTQNVWLTAICVRFSFPTSRRLADRVAEHRQSEILKQLAIPQQVKDTDVYEFMKAMMEKSQPMGIKIA